MFFNQQLLKYKILHVCGDNSRAIVAIRRHKLHTANVEQGTEHGNAVYDRNNYKQRHCSSSLEDPINNTSIYSYNM